MYSDYDDTIHFMLSCLFFFLASINLTRFSLLTVCILRTVCHFTPALRFVDPREIFLFCSNNRQ